MSYLPYSGTYATYLYDYRSKTDCCTPTRNHNVQYQNHYLNSGHLCSEFMHFSEGGKCPMISPAA